MSGNPLVVVIGQIGSGKTTLVNKLCNSKLPTEAGGKSATQSIWSVGSAYGNGFDVYDTPGFGTDENKVQHAAAIVGALTNEKVTRILVVVKFERNALMKASLEVSLNPVKRYFELVTIVVTHWDMSNNNDRDTRELTDDILPKFGIKSYLLSGKMITGESLCR
jgi:GTPase Era involved in 16S rRNA processing